MRPIKLELRNIGPFPGTVAIDFSALADVFLVCGQTGSGKTTIFDAMTWALYGALPGTREPSDLASHFSDGEDVGARFEFSVGATKWYIARSPERDVGKKRGGGTTRKPHEAALFRDDGGAWIPVSDRVGDIEATVIGLLGLSKDEFTKIVLLPQGQFQRFLEMGTSDRAQILEKLFPVSEHGAVAELARRRWRELEAEAKALDARISAMAAGMCEDPAAELSRREDALAKAAERESAAMDAVMAAERAAEKALALGRAWRELDDAVGAEAEAEGRAPEMASLKARLDRAAAALSVRSEVEAGRQARSLAAAEAQALVRAREGMAALEARSAAVDSARDRAMSIAAELAALDRKAGELNARLPSWQRALAARSEYAEAARAADARAEEARICEEAESGAAAALQAAMADALDSGLLAERRESALAAREMAAEDLRAATEADRIRGSLERAEARMAADSKALAEATLRKDGLAAALVEVERLRDGDAARRLAAGLARGKPCPVCGSTEHPAPYADAAEPGARASRREGQIELERCRAELRAADEEVSLRLAGLRSLEDSLLELRKGLAGRSAALSLAEAGERLAAAEALLGEANASERWEAERAKLAMAARKRLDEARSRTESARRVLAEAEKKLAALGAIAGEADKSAGDADPGIALADLESARERLERELSEKRAAYEDWTVEKGKLASGLAEAVRRAGSAEASAALASGKEAVALAARGFADEDAWAAAAIPESERTQGAETLARYEGSRSAARARAEAARRAVAGSARPEGLAVESALAGAKAELAEARASREGAEASVRSLRASMEETASANASLAALRERGGRLGAISALLNGEVSGRRLSFKNWALSVYFSRVSERASVRLREMSDGRYDLAVAEGRSRGRVGLELDVLDAFTGRARPASSLSGGEKFLTSISLALGLSDVIVRRAGGAALDSIFIDEGFGSLDGEALDKAMAALDGMRGDRTIGIVSHLEELRARIPSRIEVVKTNTGSSVAIR